MEDVIEQSFKISLRVLRLLGVYSYEKWPPLIKLCILTPYLLLVSVTFLNFVDLLVQRHQNSMELILSMIFVTEVSNVCIRCALFFKFGAEMKNCVRYFGHQRFQPKDEEERRMIEDCIWICHRNSVLFTVACLVSTVIGCLQPLLKHEKTLAVSIWLPYDFSAGSLEYFLSTLYVDAACVYVAIFASSTDPLVAGLVHHATTQLAILKYNLRNFHNLDKSQTEIRFETVFEFLQRSIEQHNAILQFVSDFEDRFSWVIITQLGASTLTLCFCSIGITVVDLTSVDFLLFVLLYFIMGSQIVFYCFYGTLLFEESRTLNEAIYLSPWYISDVKTRKILIILMERAKRPMVITAGKIVELTLKTLATVLKTSYSLIAVFKK